MTESVFEDRNTDTKGTPRETGKTNGTTGSRYQPARRKTATPTRRPSGAQGLPYQNNSAHLSFFNCSIRAGEIRITEPAGDGTNADEISERDDCRVTVRRNGIFFRPKRFDSRPRSATNLALLSFLSRDAISSGLLGLGWFLFGEKIGAQELEEHEAGARDAISSPARYRTRFYLANPRDLVSSAESINEFVLVHLPIVRHT